MKIALIGSHGVGKTTLCYELAAKLKRRDVDVELVTEVARQCPLPINRATSADAQAWILHTQMAREIAAATSHAVVLCDRSVLDNYCYLLYATGPQPTWEPLLARWLRTYNLLVKVPLWTTPRWDGVRETDASFQRDIEDLLERELQRHALAPLRLASEDRDGWAAQVMHQLTPQLHPMPLLFPEAE